VNIAPRLAAWVALALAIPLGLSCMHAGKPADMRQLSLTADSVTVALWHFDEPAGVRCGDAGPFRLEATAGPGTRIGYGRFGSAREFTRVIGDQIIVRGEASGKPTGEFWGAKPTGKSFKTMAIDIFTVKNGQLASCYHVENWMTALQQISK